jgi:hypothetical protein
MINVHQLINGLCVGTLMTALGLFPSFFQTLGETMTAFLYKFRIPTASLVFVEQRRWFAVFGVALIIFTLAAYFVHA